MTTILSTHLHFENKFCSEYFLQNYNTQEPSIEIVGNAFEKLITENNRLKTLLNVRLTKHEQDIELLIKENKELKEQVSQLENKNGELEEKLEYMLATRTLCDALNDTLAELTGCQNVRYFDAQKLKEQIKHILESKCKDSVEESEENIDDFTFDLIKDCGKYNAVGNVLAHPMNFTYEKLRAYYIKIQDFQALTILNVYNSLRNKNTEYAKTYGFFGTKERVKLFKKNEKIC